MSNDAIARRRLQLQIEQRRRQLQEAQPQTNVLAQLGAGATEGLTSVIGAPSAFADFTTDAITNGVNRVFGTDWATSEDLPQGRIGTAEGMQQAAQDLGVMTEVAPQTGPQRFARSVGREGGAMAIPGGVAVSRARAPFAVAGMETASAVGAGTGGQAAEEVAPGNGPLRAGMELAGGMLAPATSFNVRSGPRSPTMEQLKAEQSAAYATVDNAQAHLTPQGRDRLIGNVQGRMTAEGMDEFMHPRAFRTTKRMEAMPPTPRISEVEQKRRLAGRDVAGSSEPSESALGILMKQEIDNSMRGMGPGDVAGSDAPQALDALTTARDRTRRIKASEMVEGLVEKGERRAATSGTGGNEVNAIRQNIRTILDDPKKRRRFSDAEVEAMEEIVRGSPTANALRWAGRFSPTAGYLPATMAGVGYGLGGIAGMIPSAVGYGAKASAEAITQRQVDRLSELVRNGAPLDPKRMSEAEQSALATLFAAQLAQEGAAQ